MSDSVDRVFVHALNTVKKIPKTGASRPPPTDRMRLYGLYKQAMEGDVDGVMERPTLSTISSPEELSREQDKWDAWKSQTGLSRTEAKRRYVEALIETMHKYASTPNALELVAELEFVWNQVKSNEPSSEGGSSSSGGEQQIGGERKGGGGLAGFTHGVIRRFGRNNNAEEQQQQQPPPMRVLSPMSEPDESEARMAELAGDDEETGEGGFGSSRRNDKRSKRMERAIVRLSAEIAALREQIATGREWRTKKDRGVGAWVSWGFWGVVKHCTVDLLVLLLLLLWMRRRKDRRFEDHVRGLFRLGREYARKVLPSR
ncbi:acyl CoA binding protein-domain-containing protein [Triangularia setosa]|uniref:Acyl CoA binding protein-domain-containing protein n=1 Tax=Triangularia setosa TaxID=2587417 RepID=A0AAN6W5T2_9PEZI|nr:acyl CoA binding protein-domain-containing protein [Podospora setosa]